MEDFQQLEDSSQLRSNQPCGHNSFEIYLCQAPHRKSSCSSSTMRRPKKPLRPLSWSSTRPALGALLRSIQKKEKLAEGLAPYVNHILEAPTDIAVGIIQRFSLSVAAKDPLRDPSAQSRQQVGSAGKRRRRNSARAWMDQGEDGRAYPRGKAPRP